MQGTAKLARKLDPRLGNNLLRDGDLLREHKIIHDVFVVKEATEDIEEHQRYEIDDLCRWEQFENTFW